MGCVGSFYLYLRFVVVSVVRGYGGFSFLFFRNCVCFGLEVYTFFL